MDVTKFPKFLYASLLCMFMVVGAQAAVSFIWAPVGNVGNAPDPLNSGSIPGIGSVDYAYQIAKHEVTNSQYSEFLNTVAASDSNNLYHNLMDITRSGTSGNFTYSANVDAENHPVAPVSWFSAARFANWMHNGQGMGSTETGAYDMTLPTPVRLAGATVFLPTENEWYKAAYHDPRGSAAAGPPGDDNFWLYPTQSDTAPTAEASPGGANSANYDNAVGDMTDVGSYTMTTSFYGAFDMGGNVWEWNESASDPCCRGLRGGDLAFGAFVVQSSSPILRNPPDGTNSGGFRLASIPEPSATLLLLLGSGLCLKRRR